MPHGRCSYATCNATACYPLKLNCEDKLYYLSTSMFQRENHDLYIYICACYYYYYLSIVQCCDTIYLTSRLKHLISARYYHLLD